MKQPILTSAQKTTYLEYLRRMITPERLEKMHAVLEQRTRHLTVVLEDIYQAHNASAVLRSCECFGLLDIHIIENHNKYHVNPDVALGSSKWLNIFSYKEKENNSADCIRHLRVLGYRIIAASPHECGHSPEDLPVDQKTALVFGSEKDGLSLTISGMCDGFVKIPMTGFTESLNISVSVAVTIYTLMQRLHKLNSFPGLTQEEMTDTLIQWMKNTLKHPEMLEKDFINKVLKMKT